MKVVLKQLGTPNKNGVVYSEQAMQEAIQKLDGKPVIGRLGTGDFGSIDAAEIATVVSNIRIEDGAAVGDAIIMQTPGGNELNAILDEVVFRLAGTGKVSESGEVTDYTISHVTVIPKDQAA